MDSKYFGVAFASGGDTTPVPDAAPVDGSVSYQSGYGPDYALDPGTAEFVGSITAFTLTVTDISRGALAVGSEIDGPGVTAGTNITAFGTGSGGVGTYTLDTSQTVVSEAMTSVMNPNALLIDRAQMNAIFNDITLSLSRLQQFAFPQWITSANNDGTPYPYANGAVVLYTVDGVVYQSIVGANTATPGTDPTKWIPYLSNYALLKNSRTRLLSNATFYVNGATGSDSNDGLTVGTPWATLQHAANVIFQNYDMAGFNIDVECADFATYAGFVMQGAPPGCDTVGSILFNATSGNPAACVIAETSGSCVVSTTGAKFSIAGFGLTNSGGNGLDVNNGGALGHAGLNFGAISGAQKFAWNNGRITSSAAHTVNGSAGFNVDAANGGVIDEACAVTITGTPAYGQSFANAVNGGIINLTGTTYTGTATGKEYNADFNGVIQTNGLTLPGNIAGTATNGGQFG